MGCIQDISIQRKPKQLAYALKLLRMLSYNKAIVYFNQLKYDNSFT